MDRKTRKSTKLNAEINKNFVFEYLKDLNPYEAAVRAGFDKKVAESKAKELLENPAVVIEIKNSIKMQIARLQVDKSYIIDKLLSIAEFCLEMEDVLDKEGNPTGKQKLRDTTAGLRAVEMLSKHSGFSSSSDKPDLKEPEINIIGNLNTDNI